MLRRKRYAYDVALSFAEEELTIATEIAAALKKKGIRYYLYTEHAAKHLGKTLLQITQQVYGEDTRHVLILTSKLFVTKYWTTIESQIVQITAFDKKDFIFRLKLDDTPVDGIPPYLFSLTWNQNPNEIADAIYGKLQSKNHRLIAIFFSPLKKYTKILMVIAILGVLSYYYYYATKQKEPLAASSTNVQKIVSDSTKPSNSVAPTKNNEKSVIEPEVKKVVGKKTNQVLVPAGNFIMGSNITRPLDAPAHIVTLAAFYISKTEVTVKEYRGFAIANGRPVPTQPYNPECDNCPVVNITWQDAKDYCTWVQGRLPTEAEWEYAAVKNSRPNDKYSGGNSITEVGIYETNSGGRAHPVAQKNGGLLGIYDMSGNVAEWCNDWFGNYTAANLINPLGPDTGSKKVVRGGYYNSHVRPDPEDNQLRNTYRGNAKSSTHVPYIGFRVVWDK